MYCNQYKINKKESTSTREQVEQQLESKNIHILKEKEDKKK